MPSRLMTIKEAFQYAKLHKYKGLISYVNGVLTYINSNGKKAKVKVPPNTLIYYRGSGKWAIYDPKKDAKIISHKIRINVRDPKKWVNYGDINPEKIVIKKKKVKKKVGRGKGKKKEVIQFVPVGGGKKSI
ncbi:MAG: hypothetical protein ABGW69_03435 [Nanoarchaeota archaeon]